MTTAINILNHFKNYNTEFLCTYKRLLGEDGEDLDEDNLCYQIQLLQAFNMAKFDEFILNTHITASYQIMRDNAEIREILEHLSRKFSQINILQNIFCLNGNEIYNLLFSYDYFDMFHKCYSRYIKTYLEKTTLDSDSLFFEDLKKII